MGPSDESKDAMVSQLVEAIKYISGLPKCRNASGKMYSNLIRRVKLLSPLFDELNDSYEKLGVDEIRGLQSLKVYSVHLSLRPVVHQIRESAMTPSPPPAAVALLSPSPSSRCGFELGSCVCDEEDRREIEEEEEDDEEDRRKE